METMNIALPEALKTFVQHQVEEGGYSSVSEYMRELIRADQRRQALAAIEAEIVKGLESGASTPMTAEDWQALRQALRERYAKRRQQQNG
jgi:antitoxin ParD1/3/4